MLRKWRLPVMIIFFSLFLIGGQEVIASQEDRSSEQSRVDNINFPVLYLNDPTMKGEAVWLLEARLRDLDYDIEPDGVFDPVTSESVRLFQLANRIPADGLVSKTVWESLMNDEEGKTCLTANEEVSRIWIEIDIVKHTLTVYDDTKQIKQFPVGVGKSKTPSPLGEWKIVNKAVGWGNGFGTRWMGLNVPWGIYGIHGTNKPYSVGGSESHGCIRMLNRNVEELYPMIPWGTKVRIVEDGQIFPKNFKGRKLSIKSSGQDVVYLQSRLKELGVVLDNADGRFGNMTKLALKYYQVWHGLEPSGEADEASYRAMGMIE